MQFNLEQIDTLLSTTRAVRRRLDLDRGVPDDILLRCIDLAEQAPSGGNIISRRWLIIRDPDIKARLAALYREAGGNGIIATAERLRSSGQRRERVITSAAHLAQNLERVPALVLVTIWGTHDGSGRLMVAEQDVLLRDPNVGEPDMHVPVGRVVVPEDFHRPQDLHARRVHRHEDL